jgi:hypothetical protein
MHDETTILFSGCLGSIGSIATTAPFVLLSGTPCKLACLVIVGKEWIQFKVYASIYMSPLSFPAREGPADTHMHAFSRKIHTLFYTMFLQRCFGE